MSEKKLSEELRHCLEVNGCANCTCYEHKSVLTCRGLLQKAYEAVKKYEEMFPFKIGDMVFVDSKTLPTENMDFDEDEIIPKYFKARVVSIRKNCNGKFVKLAVRADWYYEWIDQECGHDFSYCDREKYFTYPFSAIEKTVFLTRPEAEAKLAETEVEK